MATAPFCQRRSTDLVLPGVAVLAGAKGHPIGTIAKVPYARVNDPEKLRRLVGAVLMITGDIELTDLLRDLVEEARSIVGARYAALGVLNEARTGLEQFLTAGLSDDAEQTIGPRPTGRGVLGLIITDPKPLRLANLADHADSYGFPAGHPPMTSFLGVPVRVRDDVYGNLYLTDKEEASEFSDEDEALAEALALAAGVAIENWRLHNRVRIISMLDDRDRIARDLHDRVIQRIFAVGMSLQGAARLPDASQVSERVTKAVDELDATINEIRTAIFDLGEGSLPGGLRQAILALADEMTLTLGTRPEVVFAGLLDNTVPQFVADHLLAVMREALTNASKHAGASRHTVIVTVGDSVVLEITDNGTGFDTSSMSGGLGLANLRSRAEQVGGSFEVGSAPGGGTRLVWSAPF
jgi:signal transduction histidine kinase